MNRVILITFAVCIILSSDSVLIIASPKYEVSNKYNADQGQGASFRSDSRLGRRKINLKDDAKKAIEQQLLEIWDILTETPTTVVTINGNEKFVCRNMGKSDTFEFIPRLGRNLELSENKKWLRELKFSNII